MATPQETLQEMIANMRTGGAQPPRAGSTGTMGGGTFNGKRIAGTAAPAGAQRSAVSMNGNASIRQPGMTTGQSSVPTDNPAGGLATANRLLDNPVQASRTGTEANLNPQVGEALRRNLAEQQRLSGPTYGSMGAFERRDRRDARAANQLSVNSNLAALQGIRESSVTERGQNMQATTTLDDRQMQEAGAFDRSLLQLDNTMLEGQFGLADRAAEVAGADPYADSVIGLANQVLEGDPTKAGQLANMLRGISGVADAAPATGTITTTSGLELTVPQQEAIGIYIGEQPEGDRARVAGIFGLAYGAGGKLVPQQQAVAQQTQQTATRDAADAARQQALKDLMSAPESRGYLINNQRRDQ